MEYKMKLSEEQKAILDGSKGETMAKVMETLVRYGELFGADEMVPVTSLSGEKYRQFAFSVLSGVRRALETDEKDLEWFTLKFDYRNQSKPWGNSRNALERTANRLRGRCIVTCEKDTAK